MAVREDEEAAVQALAYLEPTAGVGAAARQLDPAGAEADGVVVGDDAGVATAQEGGEIAGSGTPRRDGVGGGAGKRRLKSARNSGRKAWAASRVAMPRSRSSLTRRSCSVCQRRSMRPLAWGEPAAMNPIPSSRRRRPKCVGSWVPRSCSSTVQCGSLRTKTLRRSP